MQVIHCGGGARDPKIHNLFQIADGNSGVIRWVNADLVFTASFLTNAVKTLMGSSTSKPPTRRMSPKSKRAREMRRSTKGVTAVGSLLIIGLHSAPGLAQMRGPRISSVRDVTCVANWERRFQVISPGMWEMRMGTNDRDPFVFRETSRSTGSIWLQSVQSSRLKAILNLQRQRIKYIIPGQEYDPLYFNIQTYNINGEGC